MRSFSIPYRAFILSAIVLSMGVLAKPSEAALELGLESDCFVGMACPDIPLSGPCIQEQEEESRLCGVVSSESGPSVYCISANLTVLDRDSGVKLRCPQPFFELEEVPSPLDWVPRRSV